MLQSGCMPAIRAVASPASLSSSTGFSSLFQYAFKIFCCFEWVVLWARGPVRRGTTGDSGRSGAGEGRLADAMVDLTCCAALMWLTETFTRHCRT